jgi:hypothetical protein
MNYLNDKQLKAIKEIITDELLKRGFIAPFESFEETIDDRSGKHRLFIQSEKFQTVPVLFKEIRVEAFSSSVSMEVVDSGPEGDSKCAIKSWSASIHVDYKHFDGGTNGSRLFGISGKFYDEDYWGQEFKIR